MEIQWYPGHMTKARRMMRENLNLVDLICEIVDARIPESSRNPDLDALAEGKPRLLILNRADQADPKVTRLWRESFRKRGLAVLETDCRSGAGTGAFPTAVRSLLKEKLDRYAEKGQGGRAVRAMVAGIPNVGKSSFINRVAGRKAALTSDRPGVTRGKQWIAVDESLELLDTPGILWAKLEGENTGLNLAFTGAVRDQIMDLEELAAALMGKLSQSYPAELAARYKLELAGDADGFDLLGQAAKKRGFLISGGGYDLERMAIVLLDEFRGGKLGRISLERPGGRQGLR